MIFLALIFSIITKLFVFLCFGVALLYLQFWKAFKIFKRMGVPGPEPAPFLGTVHLRRKGGYHFFQDISAKYGKVFGIFEGVNPVLVISDAAMIKEIAVKQFDKFRNRRSIFVNRPLRAAPGQLKGDQWRLLRATISSAFSGAKMKKVNEYAFAGAPDFISRLGAMADRKEMCEMKELCRILGQNVAARTLFGIDIASNPKEYKGFAENSTKLHSSRYRFHKKMIIYLWFPWLVPILERLFDISMYPEDALDYFVQYFHQMIDMRLRSDTSNQRPDFLQLLLEQYSSDGASQNGMGQIGNGYEKKKLSSIEKDKIAANCLIFLTSGVPPMASTVAFAVHSLCLNPAVQERLYLELRNDFGTSDKITYDGLMKCEYLEAVIDETLRFYPSITVSERVCNEKCKVGDYIVPEGMVIYFNVLALHFDEEYWEDPKKFDPDRFLKANADKIAPSSYIPFGLGPRFCPGNRFALWGTKNILAHVVLNFEILPCTKTENPIEMLPTNASIPKNGVWVSLKRRN